MDLNLIAIFELDAIRALCLRHQAVSYTFSTPDIFSIAHMFSIVHIFNCPHILDARHFVIYVDQAVVALSRRARVCNINRPSITMASDSDDSLGGGSDKSGFFSGIIELGDGAGKETQDGGTLLQASKSSSAMPPPSPPASPVLAGREWFRVASDM